MNQKELLKILRYNKRTGQFTWIRYIKGKDRTGDIAGWVDRRGYRRIQIGCFSYSASRLAWLYCYGKWPRDQIDHRDCNKGNDKISNLREATNKQNGRNRFRRSDNTSGAKGVSWHKRDRKYTAYIGVDGKRKFLGYFTKKEDAAKTYAIASKEYHREFRRVD